MKCFACCPLLLVALVNLVASRSEAADTATAATHRSRLTIAEPPRDPQQVLTVFKQLATDKKRADLPPARDVFIAGTVGGTPNIWPDTHPNFPWYPGQASFFLVDNKIAQQMAAHAKHHGGSHDCVFCRQLAEKNVSAVAVVNLVDQQGKTLPIDAQKIFDLKEGQKVVLRGKAKLLAGSVLQIDADGIYVKPQATATRSPRILAK
jgi:hypothetical protein